MPNATVDVDQFTRYDLKSAPPDGYVMLRPLPYGMKLTRRDKASKMKMQTEAGRGRRQSSEIELETLNEWAIAHDFAYCIGEHNLTDKNDQLLNFTNPMTLKTLNPKIGSEIEKYIDELNEDEDDEMLEDFRKLQNGSSSEEATSLSTDSQEQSTTITAT
jgi:hypothetical protein